MRGDMSRQDLDAHNDRRNCGGGFVVRMMQRSHTRMASALSRYAYLYGSWPVSRTYAIPARVRHQGSYWQVETRIGEARQPGPPGGIDDLDADYDLEECDADCADSSHNALSQPEGVFCQALNDALARSLGQRGFLPAVTFRGARHGAAFKNGAQ